VLFSLPVRGIDLIVPPKLPCEKGPQHIGEN
jgi:hypothetical protein